MSHKEESLFENKFNELKVKYYNLNSTPNSISFDLDIWAKPGSKVQKNGVGPNGEIILHIKERPIDGAANIGLVKALSSILSIPKSSINLTKGTKSKLKRFSFYFTFTERKDVDYYLGKLNKLVG